MSLKESFRIKVPEKILIGEIVSINNNHEGNFYKDTINNKKWIGKCMFFEEYSVYEFIDDDFDTCTETSTLYNLEIFFSKNHGVIKECKHFMESNEEEFHKMPRIIVYSIKGDVVFKLNEIPLFLEVEEASKVAEIFKFSKNNELECIFIKLMFEREESLFDDYNEFLNTFKNYFNEI